MRYTCCTGVLARRQQDRRRRRNGSRQGLCQWLTGAVEGALTPHCPSSSHLEPWHTCSPGLTVLFDVPYAHVQTLNLAYNQIGNDGVSALASACASGSLAQLTVRSRPTASSAHLEPWHTRSPGLTVSFDVPYAHVQDLDLSWNQISNDGVSALASACASGSLAQLTVSSHLAEPFPALRALVCALSRLTRAV